MITPEPCGIILRAPSRDPTASTDTSTRPVRAAADVDALVALLTGDVFVSMPPLPFEYVGRSAVAGFCAALFGAGRRFVLAPVRANGQPAFGTYLRSPGSDAPGTGLVVLTLAGDRINAMTRFDHGVLARFGLPAALTQPGAPTAG